jgi:hypothetical protein
MTGSTSCATLDLVWDTLDATIVPARHAQPALRTLPPFKRPILRQPAAHPVKPVI